MRMMKTIGGSFALMTFANSLMASGAAHEINWWHLGSAYKESPALGWLSITFAIFVYGVARAVKQPLSTYLETRSNDIRQQIEEGRLAKIESEKKLKLYDEKLRSLSQEIDKMKHSLEEQAAAEKIERMRLAKEMEVRILRDADDTIRANLERTKNRLAEDAITKALEIAEKTIASQKRDQVDLVLKNNFIADLRDSAAEVKRGYVVNEFVKGSVMADTSVSAREVH